MQAAAGLPLLAVLAGCGDAPLSALHPAGPAAAAIATAWWWMAGGAALILLGVLALAAWVLRRGRARLSERGARRLVWGAGVAFPLAVLTLLLAYGLGLGDALLPQAAGHDVYRVEVTGRQWQWEVRYPDAPGGARQSSNEIHVPVGRAIDVHVSAADVIHSFWVPRLGGKIDAIPGRENTVRLRADAPGVYEGLCAEFCGLGHAGMRMRVVAHDDAALAARLRTLAIAQEAP
ncbi:Cytochrome c oxidase polypeptide II [plant metagenome]|uniref:Cytochrome c oxidase polypeptide II n=1 Tax=plant metagenome TaxID=1297885 RepID=A0A484PUT3_9ZZZZ